jgi:hypothetical protein
MERTDNMGTATKPIEAELVNEREAVVRYDPSQLLSQAIDKGLGIETLERLMALQERWQANAAKAEFFDALARFQSLVPDILKKKKAYEAMYAPLGDIDRVIKDPMRECGLSKRWEQQQDDGGKLTMTCIITHLAGHSERTSIGPVDPGTLEKTKAMNTIQQRGAVITYLQRYTLIGALGLTTADADIDARIPLDESTIEVITDAQVADLAALIEEVKADKAKFLKWAQIDKLEEMRTSEYKRCITFLEAKRQFAGKSK